MSDAIDETSNDTKLSKEIVDDFGNLVQVALLPDSVGEDNYGRALELAS